MARALMGHIGTAQNEMLAFEVVRLRRRVTELEAELSRLRAEHAARFDLDLHAELAGDLELHRITEAAEPVLA